MSEQNGGIAPVHPLKLLTQNIRSLGGANSEEKDEYIKSLNGYDVICIQELNTKKTTAEKKLSNLLPNYQIYTNCGEKKSHGTAILIINSIHSSDPQMSTDGRFITVNINNLPVKISITCAYGNANSEKTQEELRKDWKNLENQIKECQTKGITEHIILGDMNACTQPALDRTSKNTNDNRDKVYTELLEKLKLIDITDAKFSDCRSYTFAEKNGRYASRIDAILTTPNLIDLFLEVRPLNFDYKISDHAPVIGHTTIVTEDIEPREEQHRTLLPKLNTEHWKEINEELAKRTLHLIDCPIATIAKELPEIMIKTIEDLHGIVKLKRASERIYKKIQTVTEKLKADKATLIDTIEELKAGKNPSKDFQQIIYAMLGKKNFGSQITTLEKAIEKIEKKQEKASLEPEKIYRPDYNSMLTKDPSSFYKLIKPKVEIKHQALTVYDDKTNKYTHRPKEVIQETHKYWKNLYSESNPPKTTHEKEKREEINIETEPWYKTWNTTETKDKIENALNAPITLSEIIKKINKAKQYATGGEDKLQHHHLKGALPVIGPLLEKLYNGVLTTHTIPEEWKKGLIYPIHKQGPASTLDNYRGITLLPVIYKTFTAIIADRLETIIESTTTAEQAGFKRGNSTTHHLITTNNILTFSKKRRTIKTENKKKTRLEKPVHGAYLDLKKAFDSIRPWALKKALKSLNFPESVIELLVALMENAKAKIITPYGITEELDIEIGVKQGCPLSPILFILTLQPMINYLKEKFPGYTFEEILIALLAFADDILTLAQSAKDLQDMLNIIIKYLDNILIKINPAKSAYTSNENETTNTLYINDTPLPTLQKNQAYKYLGVWIQFDGRAKKEKAYLRAKCKEILQNIERLKLNPLTAAQAINTTIIPIIRYPAGIVDLNQTFMKKLSNQMAATINKCRGMWKEVLYEHIFAPIEYCGIGLINAAEDYHCTVLDRLYHHGIYSHNNLTRETTMTLIRWNRLQVRNPHLITAKSNLPTFSIITQAAKALEYIEKKTKEKISIVSHNHPDYIPSEEIAFFLKTPRAISTNRMYRKEKIYTLLDIVEYRKENYYMIENPTGHAKSSKKLRKLFCEPNHNQRMIKKELHPLLDKIRKNKEQHKFPHYPPHNITTLEDKRTVVIYTDGSCTENKAGSGIFYSKESKSNKALRTPGKQTNNTGEIYAAIYAVLSIPKNTPLLIRSDSKLVVQLINDPERAHKKSPVANIAAELRSIVKDKLKSAKITAEWVKGHDIDEGNNEADKLAAEGANKKEDNTDIRGIYFQIDKNSKKELIEGNIRRIMLNKINDNKQRNKKILIKRETLENSYPEIVFKAFKKIKITPRERLILLKLRWNKISCADHWVRRCHLEEEDAQCPECKVLHTKEHVLLECKGNEEQRKALIEQLAKRLRKIDTFAEENIRKPENLYSILRTQPVRELYPESPEHVKEKITRTILETLAKFVSPILLTANAMIYN